MVELLDLLCVLSLLIFILSIEFLSENESVLSTGFALALLRSSA